MVMLILMNGRNDNLIPYSESLALSAAVLDAQARMFLIQSVLWHIDLRVANLLLWRFSCADLPDLRRLAYD